jgi:deoxyadenosine/deoxycytidine kinase
MENITIISIEGNIGSGKSTLLTHLKLWAKEERCDNIYFALEPVDDWSKISDENGETVLSKFYKDQEKYAFSFQMMAFITRYNKIKMLIDEILSRNKTNDKYEYDCNKYIIITERCLYTDKHVFAKMLYHDKKIDEVNFKIYNSWFHTFAKEIPISKLIYVNTPYKVCDERIKNRNRDGESSIPIEYLERCEKYHLTMIEKMMNNKIIYHSIDGKEDIYNDEVLKKWLNGIKDFIKI